MHAKSLQSCLTLCNRMDCSLPSWPCSPLSNVILIDSTFCVVGASFGFEMHSPSEMPLFQGTEWLFNFHYVPSESLRQSASLHILGLMLLTHPCHFPIQSTHDPAFPSTTLKKSYGKFTIFIDKV